MNFFIQDCTEILTSKLLFLLASVFQRFLRLKVVAVFYCYAPFLSSEIYIAFGVVGVRMLLVLFVNCILGIGELHSMPSVSFVDM